MIKRFVFGTPFPTESVVLDLPVETGPVPFLTPDGDGWTYTIRPLYAPHAQSRRRCEPEAGVLPLRRPSACHPEYAGLALCPSALPLQ